MSELPPATTGNCVNTVHNQPPFAASSDKSTPTASSMPDNVPETSPACHFLPMPCHPPLPRLCPEGPENDNKLIQQTPMAESMPDSLLALFSPPSTSADLPPYKPMADSDFTCGQLTHIIFARPSRRHTRRSSSGRRTPFKYRLERQGNLLWMNYQKVIQGLCLR